MSAMKWSKASIVLVITCLLLTLSLIVWLLTQGNKTVSHSPVYEIIVSMNLPGEEHLGFPPIESRLLLPALDSPEYDEVSSYVELTHTMEDITIGEDHYKCLRIMKPDGSQVLSFCYRPVNGNSGLDIVAMTTVRIKVMLAENILDARFVDIETNRTFEDHMILESGEYHIMVEASSNGIDS